MFLERLTAAYQAGYLEFFADQAALAEPAAFKAHLAKLRKREWVVYAKPPFGGTASQLGGIWSASPGEADMMLVNDENWTL
jgi:hypothetical protein